MRIHSGVASAIGKLPRGALALGNFDGVHLGHRALFAAVRRLAAERGGPACALTFEPHPAQLLAPRFAPQLISSPLRKRELIAAQGIDALVVQPFNAEFAAVAPETFVAMLADLGIAEVVVGYDFTYGAGRRGTVESLRFGLEERGVALHVVPPFAVGGIVVSSTKVREFALQGNLDAVTALLGRPLDLDGEIVRGAGRGRTLGWPTANIRTAQELLPAMGVYAVRARFIEGAAAGQPLDALPLPLRLGPALPGAANLGLNPTFRKEGGAQAGGDASPPVLLEVHLIDYAGGDLYGRRLRVEWVQRLREERRFPGPEPLKAQIARDVDDARALLRASSA